MDADHRIVVAKIDVRVPKRKKGIERKRFKIVNLGILNMWIDVGHD